MKTNTTKFLAVLAVFAMAFAALAVAVPAEEIAADDTHGNEIADYNLLETGKTIELSDFVKTPGDTPVYYKALILSGTEYKIGTTGAELPEGFEGIYLLPGASITIDATKIDGTESIVKDIIFGAAVKDSTDGKYYHANASKITFKANELIWTDYVIKNTSGVIGITSESKYLTQANITVADGSWNGTLSASNVVIYENGTLDTVKKLGGATSFTAGIDNATTIVKNKLTVDLNADLALAAHGITDLKGGMEVEMSAESGNYTLTLTSADNAKFTATISAVDHKVTAIDCNAGMTIAITKAANATTTEIATLTALSAGSFEFTEGDFGTQQIAAITGDLVIGKDAKNMVFGLPSGNAGAITVTGSIQLKAGATATFNSPVTIQGKAADKIVGKLSIAANAEMTAKALITIDGELLVRGTLILKSGLTNTIGLALTGNGSIYGVIKSDVIVGTPVTVKITVAAPQDKTALFKAYDGSSLLYVDVQKADSTDTNVTIDLSGATSTVYLHGTISTSQTYGQTQNVVVDGDLEIKDGAVIKIYGGFLINDDCRMTITNGDVEVAGAGVDVVINGDIYVDVDGTFTVGADAKSVKINGIVENGGKMKIETTDVSVAKDGKFIINDLAKETNLKAISVAAGGLLQIGGKIGVNGTASTITNKGSVVFNEAVLENDVTVIMNGNGATVSVISATTTTKATNAVTSLTITDKDMTKPTGYPHQTYVNKITLTTTAAGDGFSGIGVAQTVTTVTTGTQVISKFTVAGNYAAVKATTGETAAKTTMVMDSDGTENANFAFTDEFTIGTGATVDVKKLTTVDYDMYVVGSSGNEAALTGYLVVNGVIAGNSYAKITPDNFHAATFSVGSATDKITYFSSIENAIEILEDYTEPIGVTIIGDKLVVNENVTIPANVSLKATNEQTAFTIGTKTNNDVVMYVTNGSSIESRLSITVYGTLYLENAKDLKTTKVTADVKTTDGTDLCYTNLYTALANAEFGDIIEVTTDKLDIIKSIVVPEGVVLNIPAGVTAEVEVKNKVTITVNGVLMTGGITGPFADKVSATAAVLVVNGIFMTSESTAATEADKIAAVNGTYKSSGAYYYISDDVGDFVYISSLADGVETAAKTFAIYGTVSELSPIELTSKTVTITAGSELIATAITLSKSTIDVTLGELTAVIYGGDGVSSLAVTDFVFGQIKDKYNSTDKVNELSVGNIGGTVVIMTGTVFTNDANVDADDESSFTVMPGAIFYIPVDMVTYLDSNAAILGDVVVAGTLYLKSKDVVVTGDITVLADSEEGIHGTLNVSAMSFVSGVITVMDDATFNLTGTITAGVEPTELGAAATIVGNVTTDYAIIAYPGADMDGMTINNKEPVSTEFYINDELFMTAYSAANKVLISNVISEPDYEFPDYKVPKDIKTDVTLWGATAATKVGDVDSLSIELDLQDVVITTSWANGLALYIDGARIMSATATLTVGIHTVSASVNAGYACDNMTITFNGVAVPVTKEGTVIVLAVDDAGSILAVSGDVYIPEPEPVTPEEKSEWTITTILLVILVILIAIMAVIVALRLNRS